MSRHRQLEAALHRWRKLVFMSGDYRVEVLTALGCGNIPYLATAVETLSAANATLYGLKIPLMVPASRLPRGRLHGVET